MGSLPTGDEIVKTAKKVKEASERKLFQKANVVGAGVGEKLVDGKPTGEPSIVVFVEKKMSPKTLAKKFSVADEIPKSIDGVATDIIEVGKIVKHSGFRGRVRPLVPGYSCGHKKITAGTIGGFFRDKDGDLVMLTNNHVAACENAAKVGDPIYQPGPHDARGDMRFRNWPDPVGSLPYFGLLKDFVRVNKSGNTQDSAIVQVHEKVVRSGLISDVYPVLNERLAGWGSPQVNMQVQKCGRTTGYTTGKVLALHSTFTIGYDFGPAKFNECVVCTAMSKGGDSGSIIMDMDRKAVALLFAGSALVTIANPMQAVKARYGLSVLGSAPVVGPVTLGGKKWSSFTRDGEASVSRGVLHIKSKANHVCYLEHPISGFKSVSCVVNSGTDKGATWGPGLVVQWANGMLKVNLRQGGSFGGYYNTNAALNVGKVKPNKNYQLRIRRTAHTVVGDVKEGSKWYKVMEVPKSVFSGEPLFVRVGKTGRLGHSGDYQIGGAIGECQISKFEIS
jgi:hypothetical protein